MARKKNPSQQPKRTQITDSSGWTHISTSNKTTYINNGSSSSKKPLPPEVPEGQTLLDLQGSHTYYRSQWLFTPCYQTLQKLLQDEVSTSLRSLTTIDRCIILGLGSLSNGRRSSWWELVFFETVVETLFLPSDQQVNEKGEKFGIYVQDPVFNDMDAAFLKSLGYVVLSDPEAFDCITPSTFLFAPHLELAVYVRALDKAKPRLCVGTDIEEYLDGANFSRGSNHEHEMENEVFNGYRDATVPRKLPEFDKDPWTQFTTMYWMKSDED